MHIGIIGLGDGGRSNIRGLRACRVRIAAICDRDTNVLRAVGEDFAVDEADRCTDFRALVTRQDLDLIVIATPDNAHFDPACAAVKAGKRIFVEKPVETCESELKMFQGLEREYPGMMLFSEKYSFAYPIEAASRHRERLGAFLHGTTFYTMQNCDRIMGGGKWRTECTYSPCAGGLSHNFMTALLFVGSPIVRVRSTGRILTYRNNLAAYGGYDSMEGVIEFVSGQWMNWSVCLAVRGADSLFGHRTVSHYFQFEQGSLTYAPDPSGDRLIVQGARIPFQREPEAEQWDAYNQMLYAAMHRDLFMAIQTGSSPRHTIMQGMDVAHACEGAFKSAKQNPGYDGGWVDVPNEMS